MSVCVFFSKCRHTSKQKRTRSSHFLWPGAPWCHKRRNLFVVQIFACFLSKFSFSCEFNRHKFGLQDPGKYLIFLQMKMWFCEDLFLVLPHCWRPVLYLVPGQLNSTSKQNPATLLAISTLCSLWSNFLSWVSFLANFKFEYFSSSPVFFS